MIKHLLKLVMFIGLLSSPLAFTSPVEVKVGGYLFPPFVSMSGQKASGFTLDLIKLLNQHQSQFYFQFVSTSPKRRYIDFKNKLFDAIFFENIKWGWQQYPIASSEVFLYGGEAFFALKSDDRNLNYLTDLTGKNIVAILGYHYEFTHHITNVKTLKKNFDITLVSSPKTVINQVINGKADIGIAAYSYLQQQMALNPKLVDKLMIADTFDQAYEHTILIRKKHALTPHIMNTLLSEIKGNGSFMQLLEKHGLSALNQPL